MLIVNALLISVLFVFLFLYGLKSVKRRLETTDDGQGKIRQFFRQRNLDTLGVKGPAIIIIIYVTLYLLVSSFVQTKIEADIPFGGLLSLTFGVSIIAWAVVQLPISVLRRTSLKEKDCLAHVLLDIGKTILIFLIGMAIISCVTNFWFGM